MCFYADLWVTFSIWVSVKLPVGFNSFMGWQYYWDWNATRSLRLQNLVFYPFWCLHGKDLCYKGTILVRMLLGNSQFTLSWDKVNFPAFIAKSYNCHCILLARTLSWGTYIVAIHIGSGDKWKINFSQFSCPIVYQHFNPGLHEYIDLCNTCWTEGVSATKGRDMCYEYFQVYVPEVLDFASYSTDYNALLLLW